MNVAAEAWEVHADAGAETAEEHAAGFEDAPELGEHGAEVAAVASKVEHGVAQDHVGEVAGERHLFDGADLKVFRGQVGLEGRGKFADVVDGCLILVDGVDLAALAKQVDEVAAVAASGVDDGHAGLDVAAEDLIEEVDIDLAELFLDVDILRDPGVLRVHCWFGEGF